MRICCHLYRGARYGEGVDDDEGDNNLPQMELYALKMQQNGSGFEGF